MIFSSFVFVVSIVLVLNPPFPLEYLLMKKTIAIAGFVAALTGIASAQTATSSGSGIVAVEGTVPAVCAVSIPSLAEIDFGDLSLLTGSGGLSQSVSGIGLQCNSSAGAVLTISSLSQGLEPDDETGAEGAGIGADIEFVAELDFPALNNANFAPGLGPIAFDTSANESEASRDLVVNGGLAAGAGPYTAGGELTINLIDQGETLLASNYSDTIFITLSAVTPAPSI